MMKVEQLFTGCLAEMAYYIESNGEAAIIDPLRETEPYLRMAEADNAKIKYVFRKWGCPLLTNLFTNKFSCLFTLGDDEAANEGLLGGAETELDTEW